MRIQELEKELNITRSNIRFYEKEGLISPPRKENGYREYSEDDIAKLKKIIIFRKLGISVADIKSIFDGTLSLQTAIENNIARLHKEIEELNGAIEVCEQIKEDNSEEKDFPQDHFWNVINNREKQGEKFNDIFKDYSTFLKFVFEESYGFNYDEIKDKYGIKGVIFLLLILSIGCGILNLISDKQGVLSFVLGFLFPLFALAVGCIILSPTYFWAKKNSKLASIYLTILAIIIGVFFAAIGLLFIYALFNTIFE